VSVRLGTPNEPERTTASAAPSLPVQDLDLTQHDTATTALTEPEPATDGMNDDAVVPVSDSAMIVFENVTKVYEPGVTALQSVSFTIEKGEFVFVVGASGSGKSTVIRLLL
jgi:ABC-type multidrug transport system fused ATPase/permease subunit